MTTYAVIATATNICDNVVVWDDNLGPWNPPADHYIINIDGTSVGIGFYYDQATQIWTAPPTVSGSFSPAPIFLSQTTTLTWTSLNATSVTIDGEAVATTGSKDYTPVGTGTKTVTIVATGLAGSTTTTASVKVVASQAELDNPNAPTVL
jgi:hypothetical protein